MFITKVALPRRTFLRGVGASIALPLLDSMVPALSALQRTAAKPATRLAFYYASNGMYMPDWVPNGVGTSFEMSKILAPLTPFRDHIVVVSGLDNAVANNGGSGQHTRAQAVFLTGTMPKRTEGADIQAGTSVDQYAAKALGTETPLMSLELALEPSSAGNCDNGYSCAYVNTFSWRTPTTPMPMENNPRVVFERLFGDGGSASARAIQMRRERSILDSVTADMARLEKKLAPGDRTTVSDYLEAVREVERRIQTAERQSGASPVPLDQPLGVPDSFDEHAKLMLELQFLAYRADITRVVSFQISREQSARTYPWIGVAEAHHDVSHHNNTPEKIAKNDKINTYHLSLVAGLVEKMKATPDGDGSLLDHSMMMYGSGFGDGSLHMPRNLPIVIIGGGSGQLRGGRHIAAPAETPFMNLGLSLLETVGVHVDRIGDSTGPLADL
jgi:hypothetical protein